MTAQLDDAGKASKAHRKISLDAHEFIDNYGKVQSPKILRSKQKTVMEYAERKGLVFPADSPWGSPKE